MPIEQVEQTGNYWKGLSMRPSRTDGWMMAIATAGVVLLAYVAGVTGGDLNPTQPITSTMRSLDEIYKNTQPALPTNWAPMPNMAQVTGAGAVHMAVTGHAQGAIRGGCTYKGRENTSVVVGLFHEVVSPRDAASGLPTGKRQHKPLVVTKYLDRATPLLYQALVNNENLTRVLLTYYRPDREGVPQVYYTIELRNASIADIQAGFPNTEQISFCYEKIIWTWTDGGIMAEDDWEAPIS
jgi:type VI secretion system secreted protein Hcp